MGAWGFRLRASSFCSGAKGTKRPPGAAHGHLQCPIPPPPDPLFFLRESHQGARLYPSGAGKGQDTAPRAARCRSLLLEQAYLLQEPSRLAFPHRGTVRWWFRLRGWCQICKTVVSTHLLQVCSLWRFRRPQAYPGAEVFRLLPPPGGYIQ